MDPQVIEAAWRHAFERIQAAPVETAPFAHFAVDGVFPEDFYAEMIARLPDDDGYAFGDERGAEGPERHRGAIDFFQTDVAERVADARGAFWKDLTNAEVTRDLATLVLGKFGPHFDAAEIHQRFGAQPQVRGKWLLTRDRAGYLLTPHNDTPM
ncbi:MAG: hypothetical protein OXR84_11385, partial [Magnetovibrio sp.]|nr:hypothetical protein [Magnetovibrio sp.]